MAFEPRGENVIIGGIPWLARMIDKARAKANGTIEDYTYPCPKDKELLEKLGLSADEFLYLVVEHSSDEEIIIKLKSEKIN